jgi:hypothetical protein
MKLLQGCWSELLTLNVLYLQTTHLCADQILMVSIYAGRRFCYLETKHAVIPIISSVDLI